MTADTDNRSERTLSREDDSETDGDQSNDSGPRSIWAKKINDWLTVVLSVLSVVSIVGSWISGAASKGALMAAFGSALAVAGIGMLMLTWVKRRRWMAIIAALSMVLGGLFVGGAVRTWLPWLDRAPDRTRVQNTSQPPMSPLIVSPRTNELVGPCLSIRGIAPTPAAGEAYWLVSRDSRNDLYLLRPIAVDTSMLWDLTNVGVGTSADVGKQYVLQLVRTDADHTRDFDRRRSTGNDRNRYLGQELPAGVRAVHQVSVTRKAGPAC